MGYQIDRQPSFGMAGYPTLGALADGKKPATPPGCPPIRFTCSADCPFPPTKCADRRKELCERILGAIKLAKQAAARLEAKPRSAATVTLFNQVFAEDPSVLWELPGFPTTKLAAGDLVARRFRTVADELTRRDTLYKCVPASRCLTVGPGGVIRPSGGVEGGGGGSVHPTETVVVDTVAAAVLCQNEVWLCPKFWTLKKDWQEGTLIHEMLHLCFGLTCAWFQHDKKEKKRNSAYCYEVFAGGNLGPVLLADPTSISECAKVPK